MSLFDVVSRRTFACLLAVSCGVLAAVPAAADVVYPSWYGGAVKAMDRMGISQTDYPVWLRDDVASRIPQMHGDYTVDADLADRRDGVMSDADVDAAVDRRAARLVYKDVTVDLVKLWDVYGKVYADGYAQSTSGALHYGDAGYIPTSDEIDEWSQKLTVTTSELDRQAGVNADIEGSDAGTEANAYRSICGGVNRAYAADYMVRPASSVMTYPDRKTRKSDEYKRLNAWKRDDGSEYARDILEREEYTGADDAFSGEDKDNAAASQASDGEATARDKRIAKVKQHFAQTRHIFNSTADFFGSILNIVGIPNVVHSGFNIFSSDDNFCNLTHEDKGDSSFTKSLADTARWGWRALAGIDCDDYDARHWPADGEVTTSLRTFAKQPHSFDSQYYNGFSEHPTAWYYADVDGSRAYFRVYVYTDKSDSSVSGIFLDDTDMVGPDLPKNILLQNRFSLMVPIASNYYQAFENFDRHNLSPFFKSLSYDDDLDYFLVSLPKDAPWRLLGPRINGVSGSEDWVMSHLLVHYDAGDDSTTGCLGAYGSNDLECRASVLAKNGYGRDTHALTKCDDSCPAKYRPGTSSVRVTATPKDSAGNPVGSGSSGPAYDGSGTPRIPSGVSVPVGADGKTKATSISYDAKSSDGGSIHVGDQPIPQIDTSTISKRLDLIDTKTGRSCFSEGYACASWYTETQQLVPDHQLTVDTKTTTKEQPALTYKCSYDVPGKITEVSIGECVAYAHAFEESAQRTGATASDPDGNAITDPVTSADPKVDYGTCLRQETAGNAAKWLYEPVACAGRILFKPDDKVTRTTRTKVERSTRDTVVVKLDMIRENWRPVFTDGLGDCSGYHVSFKFAGIPVFDDADFLDACPGQPLDWLPVLCRAFLTIACALGVMLLCRRAFMAIFDFHTGGDGQ